MQSAGKNIFWLTFSRAAALVILFFAYTQLFRYLGRFGTGQHQFVLSYGTIFAVIVDFGIQQYIIKKMTEKPEEIKKYFQHFLVVEIFLALFVYLTMLLFAWLSGYEAVVFTAIAVAGLGIVVNALTYPFLSVMSAYQDLKKVAFINFLQSLVNVLVIFATIYFQKYIVFLVSNQLIFGLISLVLYYNYVKKHLHKPELAKILNFIDYSLVKKILKASLPFALLVGFSTIYNRIDIIIITKILGYEHTGDYTAAYKFFDLVSFFPSVVSFSLYPMFASLMAKNAVIEIKENIEKYLRLLVALALPMAFGGMVLSKQIILLVAGEGFPASSQVLSILIWAPAVLFIYIVANSLVISQLTKFAVIITGINVVVNILGNLILVPKFGINAAAGMTVFSEVLQGIFYFYFVYKKITPFKFFAFFVKPFLASMVMLLAIWQLRDLFILIPLIVGAVAYGATLLLLKFFKKQDLDFIKSFFSNEQQTI